MTKYEDVEFDERAQAAERDEMIEAANSAAPIRLLRPVAFICHIEAEGEMPCYYCRECGTFPCICQEIIEYWIEETGERFAIARNAGYTLAKPACLP